MAKKQSVKSLRQKMVDQFVEQFGETVKMHIEKQEWERAHDVINNAQRRWRESQLVRGPGALELNLGETHLELRLVNALNSVRISSVSQLSEAKPDHVMKAQNMGPKSLMALCDFLRELGLPDARFIRLSVAWERIHEVELRERNKLMRNKKI